MVWTDAVVDGLSFRRLQAASCSENVAAEVRLLVGVGLGLEMTFSRINASLVLGDPSSRSGY